MLQETTSEEEKKKKALLSAFQCLEVKLDQKALKVDLNPIT